MGEFTLVTWVVVDVFVLVVSPGYELALGHRCCPLLSLAPVQECVVPSWLLTEDAPHLTCPGGYCLFAICNIIKWQIHLLCSSHWVFYSQNILWYLIDVVSDTCYSCSEPAWQGFLSTYHGHMIKGHFCQCLCIVLLTSVTYEVVWHSQYSKMNVYQKTTWAIYIQLALVYSNSQLVKLLIFEECRFF